MGRLGKLSTLIPLEEVEHSAMQQVYNNLEHDFLIKMALMPDVHAGYDLPIGAVALLDGKISPSYVGYDIGCGMCFVDTLTNADFFFRHISPEELFDLVMGIVPMGVGVENDRSQPYEPFVSASGDKNLTSKVSNKVQIQLGTLGAGNHFIEIGTNNKGNVCAVVHSGSRNVGHSVAGYYMKQGRFLDLDSDLGRAYLQDMNFCLDWALANRLLLMKRTLIAMEFHKHVVSTLINSVVNENHNHAIVTPDGVLHRKGATPADLGQVGIIPANMRDGSYITKDLGNKDFLSSASHGAGRTMSRSKAKQSITLGQFEDSMSGIIAKVDKSTLDESPMAYKSIDTVIKYQEGVVVDVIDKIKPVVNLKG